MNFNMVAGNHHKIVKSKESEAEYIHFKNGRLG